MSLRSLVTDLLKNTALPLLDDIPVPFIITHANTQPHYDTESGEVIAPAAAESSVQLILSPVGKATRERLEAQRSPIGDVEALALDVSSFVRPPATGDEATDTQTMQNYKVVDVTSDELQATYTLVLLKLGELVDDDDAET